MTMMCDNHEQFVFTPDNVKVLKQAYRKAAKEGAEQFTFEGKVLLTQYAKYLLEYLAMQGL